MDPLTPLQVSHVLLLRLLSQRSNIKYVSDADALWRSSLEILFVDPLCPCPRSQRNDDIDDTAQQAQANFNCYPRGAALPTTCPGKPANQPQFDPVNNYMGYSE